MTSATVRLSFMLATVLGVGEVPVHGATLREALEDLLRLHPALRVHLFDENQAFRRHVLCFHNKTNTRWLESLDVPISPGDHIVILQAVSGG
jgi:molybdopterin converting factor small subunit